MRGSPIPFVAQKASVQSRTTKPYSAVEASHIGKSLLPNQCASQESAQGEPKRNPKPILEVIDFHIPESLERYQNSFDLDEIDAAAHLEHERYTRAAWSGLNRVDKLAALRKAIELLQRVEYLENLREAN